MPTVNYTNVGGQVIAEKRGGNRSFYGADPLGSTVALYDSSGTATDTFSYWPYGEVRASTGSTATPFKFCGIWGYYSDTTGRLYVRARFYKDKLARWQTVDANWVKYSRYSYGWSSPVTFFDPLGLRPKRLNYGLCWPPGLCFEYANYCGADNVQPPGQGIMPVDCIDACCQRHDRCLEAHEATGYTQACAHKCCDYDLGLCAENVLLNPQDCCKQSNDYISCVMAADLIMATFYVMNGCLWHFAYDCPDCMPIREWGPWVRCHWEMNPTPPGVTFQTASEVTVV